MSKSKICKSRAWNLVYDTGAEMDPKDLLKQLSEKKYGCYMAFCVKHVKDGKPHYHVGFITRDKVQMAWSKVTSYWSLEGAPAKSSEPLKSKCRDMGKKLQVYYNYCVDESKHPEEEISVQWTHKWEPVAGADKDGKPPKPQDVIMEKILDEEMTVDQLDQLLLNPNGDADLDLRKYALRHYDDLCQQIATMERLRQKVSLAKTYDDATKNYRPFQKGLKKILDTQNDRQIHCHVDKGNTGKNYFCDQEGLREDPLVCQSACPKDIAYAWNPKKHKRVIIDVPKGKMEYLNTSALEKLKNGFMFSTKYKPEVKKSLFKPTIVVLGNECIDGKIWTSDRLTVSTTDTVNYTLDEYEPEPTVYLECEL